MKIKLTLAAASLLLAIQAEAVHMIPLSVQQLTDKAQVILHGSLTTKSVQRDPEGRIYTRIELEVAEVWKGDATLKSFVAVQSGGVLGEESVTVDGQEEFSVGEEVVLFLVLNPRGEGVVIGLSQGKFKVTRDANGEKAVHNRFHGVAPDQEPGMNNRDRERRERLSLAALKSRVRRGRP